MKTIILCALAAIFTGCNLTPQQRTGLAIGMHQGSMQYQQQMNQQMLWQQQQNVLAAQRAEDQAFQEDQQRRLLYEQNQQLKRTLQRGRWYYDSAGELKWSPDGYVPR